MAQKHPGNGPVPVTEVPEKSGNKQVLTLPVTGLAGGRNVTGPVWTAVEPFAGKTQRFGLLRRSRADFARKIASQT